MTTILETSDLQEEKDKVIKSLSGGSKRKLSLAMSLMGESRVLFLDEPTSGMDACSRREIWEMLRRVRMLRKTVVLTTHYLDEAEAVADRVGIMSRGQLLAVGSVDYVKKKFGEGYTLRVTTSEEAIHQKQTLSRVVHEMVTESTLSLSD